jgi:hypothetical protein
MLKWNRFSEEVRQERETCRTYGLDRVNDKKPVTNYKTQALRELALRLEMEQRIAELERQNAELIDKLESQSS